MFEEMPETPYAFRRRIQFIYKEIKKRIEIIEDKKSIKIIDIGCGTGEMVTIPLGISGVNVLGVDTHLPSIEYARERNSFKNVQFECLTIEQLFGQQSDFIICSEVLEHLERPKDMLVAIKKILKKEGICIITIPNGFGPKEMEVRLYRILESIKLINLLKLLKQKLYMRFSSKTEIDQKDTLNNVSPHIQFFSYKKFEKLLRKSGLKILKCENRRFLSGPFSNKFLSMSERLISWNIIIAEKLPHFCASSWMFVITRNKE